MTWEEFWGKVFNPTHGHMLAFATIVALYNLMRIAAALEEIVVMWKARNAREDER